ncbi:YbaY family lipoprotein [Aeromicrobium sp. A1-2]|uniref:YbaY family lipoprotein n=1 Tax=Aeromicrobium sp. A1-2 TaxID=2107713 RepID=UPI0013C31DAC|nr:YbaY family lipoprotein [Aeromicrobium sp. A1-2]
MASAPVLTVHGTVFFRERIAVPPGAVATIKLTDADGEVLAATAIEAPGVPVEFTLHVDPEFVADPDALLIWAALRTESGVWGTTELVAVTSGSTEVLLTKIDD